MKFVRKYVSEVPLRDIASGDCFRFPGTNSMAYMRLMPTPADGDVCAYVSMESGQIAVAAPGTLVLPITV